MAHKGHAVCEHSSKAACEKARRVALGQCSAMLDESRQCDHWGTDRVEERAYCGQHLRSVVMAADNARRTATARDAMNERIDRALAWHATHPSVWDPLPADWSPS